MEKTEPYITYEFSEPSEDIAVTIKGLETFEKELDSKPDDKASCSLRAAIRLAVLLLRELQQYRFIDNLDGVRRMKEKQKSIHSQVLRDNIYYCPCCGRQARRNYDLYCSGCGQALRYDGQI